MQRFQVLLECLPTLPYYLLVLEDVVEHFHGGRIVCHVVGASCTVLAPLWQVISSVVSVYAQSL